MVAGPAATVSVKVLEPLLELLPLELLEPLELLLVAPPLELPLLELLLEPVPELELELEPEDPELEELELDEPELELEDPELELLLDAGLLELALAPVTSELPELQPHSRVVSSSRPREPANRAVAAVEAGRRMLGSRAALPWTDMRYGAVI